MITFKGEVEKNQDIAKNLKGYLLLVQVIWIIMFIREIL